MAGVRTTIWAAMTVLALAACGSAPAATTASRSRPSPTAATATTAPPASAPPSSAQVAVPDFPVVPYQGDQVFGGHEGRFSAAFAAGRPVVLLYFAGL
jgi:hypothetical protein